ncbi:hypothetical protein QQM79_15210 [Marinobacteraceae bacterium S3BR75-40.1]
MVDGVNPQLGNTLRESATTRPGRAGNDAANGTSQQGGVNAPQGQPPQGVSVQLSQQGLDQAAATTETPQAVAQTSTTDTANQAAEDQPRPAPATEQSTGTTTNSRDQGADQALGTTVDTRA